MDGHTFVMDWVNCVQIFSLAWAKLSTIRDSLSNFLILSSNLWHFCISCTYKVSFFTFYNSKFWNFCNNFSFSSFCMANSYDNIVGSATVEVDSMDVDDELGSVPTTTIGTIVTGTIASCVVSFSFNNSSICSSIFFICIFCSMRSFTISSFCCSFYAISFLEDPL